MPRPLHAAIVLAFTSLFAAPAHAWDAHGHRLITYLALDALPFADKPARVPAGQGAEGQPQPAPVISMPLWLTSPAVRDACAYQSAEPDRIRAQPTPSLVHVSAPDHYLDVDMLPRWGMTLETMPTLRHRFIKELTLARPKFPQNFLDYDEKKDAANEHEWPGLGAQAIMESYGHLQASFRTLKIIEIVGAEGRAAQIETAQANAIYHIGRLSHFVGDHAQPLHTTIHHHGWVRDPLKFPDPTTDAKLWNPNDYTPDYGFHSYIDGTILVHHQLTVESMMKEASPPGTPVTLHKINDMDPWQDVLEHIKRSFKQVEPLYQMHKDDTLRGPQGKAFIEERLRDGASMLAAMITAAWTSSDPTKRDIGYFTGGTPAAGQPSIPEIKDRQIPARSGSEFEERKAARDAAKKAGAKTEQ